KLATEHPPAHMFTTLQCFLPLMTSIVADVPNSAVIGLRGDGLIAAFGFGETQWRPIVTTAYEAGMVMIETTQRILNPVLAEEGIPIVLKVGIGIDVGTVLVTKIGFGTFSEVTAYGPAVNTAAKNSKGVNRLWLSADANRLYRGDEKG